MTPLPGSNSRYRRRGRKRGGNKATILTPIGGGQVLTPIGQPGLSPLPGLSGPGTRPPGAPAPAPRPPAVPTAGQILADPFGAFAGDSAVTTQGVGLAHAGYDATVAGVNSGLTENLRRLGIVQMATADPVTGRKFRIDDESNPYSVAARIKQQMRQRRGSDVTNLAAGGFLLDGAYGRALRATNRAEGEAYDSLYNQATDYVTDAESQKTQAYADALAQITGLRQSDADRAAATIPDAPPAAPKPKGGGGGGNHGGGGHGSSHGANTNSGSGNANRKKGKPRSDRPKASRGKARDKAHRLSPSEAARRRPKGKKR